MGQAHPHPPCNGRKPGSASGETGERHLVSVPAPLPPQPRRKRGAIGGFLIGTLLGYGLAGPLPNHLSTIAASFGGARPGLSAVLDPFGIGSKRILVLGSDVVGGNTDVMFTVQIRDGITEVLQVPRDTYVESEELGVVKANALYAFGGVETTLQEVGRLLGVPVDHYLKVNLDAVARIAEELGGVEIDVPKRMYYVDNAQGLYIDLYPGRQLLRGEDLEGFLRFRHDEMGDLGRMDRQQQVLAQIFRQLASPTTLTRLPALLEIAGEDVRTDLSPVQLSQLASAMATTSLRTERLPGRLYWYDDLSFWMPDSNLEHASVHEAEEFSPMELEQQI